MILMYIYAFSATYECVDALYGGACFAVFFFRKLKEYGAMAAVWC